MQRFERSLEIVGVETGLDRLDWEAIAIELVERNRSSIDPNDDLAVGLWVTPGRSRKFSAGYAPRPTVCGHAHPVDFNSFHRWYREGQRLVIANTRQVDPQNWPAELKCRSRMHYYLADQEARESDSSARAVLLDLDGHICEASTANLLAYFKEEGLVSPRMEKALPGISLGFLDELARELKIPIVYRDMSVEEFQSADEILSCSTSPCIWPATRLNGSPVGSGKPGLIFGRLIAAWSDKVGVDIAAQAERFAAR